MNAALRSRHSHPRSLVGLERGHRNLHVKLLASNGEVRVLADLHPEKNVAIRSPVRALAALSSEPDLAVLPNAGRNTDLDRALSLRGADAQLLRAAKYRITEVDRDLGLQVDPAPRHPYVGAASSSWPRSSAEEVLEVEVELRTSSAPLGRREGIAKVEAPAEASTAPRRSSVRVGVEAIAEAHLAELIVELPLLGIRHYIVGVRDIFESLLSFLVVGIAVRVQLTGELSVRLLELVGTRTARYPQSFVEIAVSHGDRAG